MDKGKASHKPEQISEKMELLDQETMEKVVGGGIRINVKPGGESEPTGVNFDAKDKPGSLGH